MLASTHGSGGFRPLARRLLRGLGVERSGRRREPVRRGRAERAGDRSVDRRALRDGQRADAHLRAGRPVPRAPGVVRAAGVAAGSNRSPLRRCAPAGHSSTERARSRGRASRPGRIRRTVTMRHRASRNTTVIGNRMPNVCTDRQGANSIAWSGGRKPRSRSPRIRSRRVAGTSTDQTRSRGSMSRVVRMERNATRGGRHGGPGGIRTRDTRVKSPLL